MAGRKNPFPRPKTWAEKYAERQKERARLAGQPGSLLNHQQLLAASIALSKLPAPGSWRNGPGAVYAYNVIQSRPPHGQRAYIPRRESERLLKRCKEAIQKVAAEGQWKHEDVTVATGYSSDTMRVIIKARCRKCGKTWQQVVYAETMLHPEKLEQHIRAEVIPYFAEALESDCTGQVTLQVVQETVTIMLAKAGPAGLPYAQVVHELLEGGTVSRATVESAIAGLGMPAEWKPVPGAPDEWRLPVLTLPAGHPSRTW